MVKKPLLSPTGRRRTFSSVFRETEPDANKWRIMGSGVQGFPVDAHLTQVVVDALESNGVEVRQYSMGSPANVSSYHLEAKFRDGGLSASTGTYWYGKRGAWIEGRDAVEWVVELLDLVHPK
jgi:hypothetical protein